MKIRNGFVSNSSSTSFCIYGIKIDDVDECLDKMTGECRETKTKGCKHEFDREKAKFCSECGAKSWNIKIAERDAYSDMEIVFGKLGLDAVHWEGGEGCCMGWYVGINLKSSALNAVDDKLKILKGAEGKMKEVFPDKKPQFYADGGYNG